VSKLPWLQLFPADWLSDALAGCSLGAQGLWLRMMFIMHTSERYGYLMQNGAAIPSGSIARRCGCTPEQYDALLIELDTAGVPSRTSDGVIFSRRMVRDESRRSKGRGRVEKHRTLCNADVTPHISEIRDQNTEVRKNLLLEANAAFSCEFFQVSKDQFAQYEQAYPAVPVATELSKMAQWLKANGEKKNYPRFITNWLASAHTKLLGVQVGTEVREGIRAEQRRIDANVGTWEGYK
jgi:hypothetical protein